MIRLKNIFSRHRVLVLMYHRIAEISVDPWDLAVSPSHFEQHLQIVKPHIISLDEVIQQLKKGYLSRSGYCISFDDGYKDNYLNAVPLLNKYRCPASFFISSGFTGSRQMFWWDILTEIFLIVLKLPGVLEMRIGDHALSYVLENEGRLGHDELQRHKTWRWPAPAPSQRCKIYLEIWQALRDLPDEEIRSALQYLIDWSGFRHTGGDEPFPMTCDELQSISANNMFTFGVHTITHPALGSHSADDQRAELTGCRDFLRSNFDNYINAVAYPYGHYNANTTSVMKQENFEAGVTTQEKPVSSSSNIYELGRIKIGNLPGNEFKKLLSTWYPN